MRFYLRTLGRLALHADGPDGDVLLGPSKSLALLAYLADRPGRTAGRGHLAALLWPGESARGRRSLRQAIYYLSKRAGAPLLEAEGDALRLREDRLEADFWKLEVALEEKRWRDAVELYGGRFLADFEQEVIGEFTHWAEARQEKVWSGYKAALHRLVSARLEERRPEAAVRWARRLVELNPLDEAAQTALVTAQASGGDAVAALQTYEAYRTLLEKELADEPGADLRERAAALREEVRASPPLAPPSPPDVGPVSTPPAEEAQETEERSEERSGDAAPRPTAPVLVVLLLAVAALAAWTAWEARRVAVAREGAGARAGGTTAPPVGAAASAGAAGDERGTGAVLWLALSPRQRGYATLPFTPGTRDATAPALDAPSAEASSADGAPLDPSPADAGTEGDLSPPVLRGTELLGPIPSPSGRRVAVQVPAGDGQDFAVLETASRDTIFRFTHPSDDIPLAWSPDGRRLIFSQGMAVDSGYARRLVALDPEKGVRWILSPHFFPAHGGAAWSPSGVWIAFPGVRPAGEAKGDGTEAGGNGAERGAQTSRPAGAAGRDTALFLAHPDGSGLRTVAPHPAWDGDPAWAPDGGWLAFSSRRGGSAHLYRVRADGTGLETLLSAPADELHPRWIDGRRLVYVRDDGTRRTLRLLDLRTGRTRALAGETGVETTLGIVRLDRAGRWIEALRIREPPARASPGQWLRLATTVERADGEAGPGLGFPLRWSIRPEGAAELPGAGRLVRIRRTGRLELVARLPGWRADTTRLLSLPLRKVSRPALLEEDWSDGIDPDRWAVYGEPRPEVVETRPETAEGRPEAAETRANRFRRVFVSRGDENHESGVATRQAFDASAGLTLEAWGRLPEGARIFNDLSLSFKRSLEPEGTANWRFGTGNAGAFMLKGRDPDLGVWTADTNRNLPPPDDIHAWHRYALQLAPDGIVSLVIDGRLYWRAREPISLEEGERLHAVVAGRARDVPVSHGPVTLWRGVRYAFGAEGTGEDASEVRELREGEAGAWRSR